MIRCLMWPAALLALLLGLGSAWAQGADDPIDVASGVLSQYKIDGWQEEHGLPISAVQALHQSRDGMLWVGTGSGLARFNGLRFVRVESAQLPLLSQRPIFGFLEASDGALWIAHTGGVVRHQDGRFESMVDPELLQGRRVWAFAQARDGSLWIATENGLLHWHQGQVRLFGLADGLPTLRLRTLAFDRQGVLWIGSTGGGLTAYRDGTFQPFGPAQGFPHAEVRHLLADPLGGVWAATPGAGLVHVGEDGQLRRYTMADGLPSDHLTYLARDAAGDLWIGSWGAGLTRWRAGRFSSVNSELGLGGDQVWTVHADREGSIWVGSWNGDLNRLRRRTFAVVGRSEGLVNDNTRAALQARDGSLWISTAGGGVNRIQNGQITALTRKDGLPTHEMSTLHEDADGSIWMGSYTDGLARWQQGRVERFGSAQGLPQAEVRSLHRDRAGTLWIGTRNGLVRRDGQGFHAVSEADAPKEGVFAILEDRQGVLWFGTSGEGLYRYQEGRFSRLTRKEGLLSNWIMALYEDSAGTLWIGTNGEGINRLRDGKLASIRTTDGLWDGLAQVFLEDRFGRLWMTCNRGVYWVARAELDAFAQGRTSRIHSTAYGPGDALRSPTFAGGLQAAGTLDAMGRLWLPSLKGLVIVDPQQLAGPLAPPPVQIEAVALNDRKLPTHGPLTLPPDAQPPLTIRYAAGTVLHAERVRFRYQMEGMTPEWIEVGDNREASFPALPHGAYRFRVASTLDGERWRESEPLAITVQPQLHQTLWFQLLALVAGVAALLALFRFRTRQLHQRHADMERLVADKTEALRLANEHLSQLSFTDALTGLANRRCFDEELELQWRRCARQPCALALLLIDVDAFKAYNDSLGHVAGDVCLRAVAAVLHDLSQRTGHFAARYGGEEFVLLIPGLDTEAAAVVAEQLRSACEARALPHPNSPVGPVVTISLGVAAGLPSALDTPAALFAAADAALYRAKQDGRNQVRSQNAGPCTPP